MPAKPNGGEISGVIAAASIWRVREMRRQMARNRDKTLIAQLQHRVLHLEMQLSEWWEWFQATHAETDSEYQHHQQHQQYHQVSPENQHKQSVQQQQQQQQQQLQTCTSLIDYSKWDHLQSSSDEDEECSWEEDEDEDEEEEEVAEEDEVATHEEYDVDEADLDYSTFDNNELGAEMDGESHEGAEEEEEKREGENGKGKVEANFPHGGPWSQSAFGMEESSMPAFSVHATFEDAIAFGSSGESNRAACLAFIDKADQAIQMRYEAAAEVVKSEQLQAALAQQRKRSTEQAKIFTQSLQVVSDDDMEADKARTLYDLIAKWRDELLGHIDRTCCIDGV